MNPRFVGQVLFASLAAAIPASASAADCSIFSSTLAFGNYDVLSAAPTDSTTGILIFCTRNPPPDPETVSYTLTLSVGAGSYAARTMNNGAATIGYNLYTSPSMSPATIWGNGTGGSVTVTGSLAPLNAQNPLRLAFHTIYGRIPARQDVPVGAYSSSVLLTINY